ncbi:MAG TPA: hypothetical protein VFS40_15425 [Gemmatimonadales bacterium]|nr:hypothetical protein [Gemmatimonadales bacterium]
MEDEREAGHRFHHQKGRRREAADAVQVEVEAAAARVAPDRERGAHLPAARPPEPDPRDAQHEEQGARASHDPLAPLAGDEPRVQLEEEAHERRRAAALAQQRAAPGIDVDEPLGARRRVGRGRPDLVGLVGGARDVDAEDARLRMRRAHPREQGVEREPRRGAGRRRDDEEPGVQGAVDLVLEGEEAPRHPDEREQHAAREADVEMEPDEESAHGRSARAQ